MFYLILKIIFLIYYSNCEIITSSITENDINSKTKNIFYFIKLNYFFLAEICVLNNINIINRTSTMFTGYISYNCSSINSSELFVFVNETLIETCYINNDLFEYNLINITCNQIENYAGRNWIFTIKQINNYSQIIFNQTFIITLKPISLQFLTNISIEFNNNLTLASIFIPNCWQISNLEYLIIHCNNFDILNESISDNCLFICSNIQPGSIYQSLLIRLPIPIIDQINKTFDEEILFINYQTGF